MKTTHTTLNLRSETVQEILSVRPHWIIRYGNLITLAIFMSLIAMAGLMRYPVYVPISDVSGAKGATTFKARVASDYHEQILSGRKLSLRFTNDGKQQQPLSVKAIGKQDGNDAILFVSESGLQQQVFTQAAICIETTFLAVMLDRIF